MDENILNGNSSRLEGRRELPLEEEIGATKLYRRGQYKEDFKITVYGAPTRVQKCMGVDKRQTSSQSFSSFLFAVVIPAKHASRKITGTRGKLGRGNSLRCHGISCPDRQTAIFIGSVARYVSYSVYLHARPIRNVHSNVSHRRFGFPSNVCRFFRASRLRGRVDMHTGCVQLEPAIIGLSTKRRERRSLRLDEH